MRVLLNGQQNRVFFTYDGHKVIQRNLVHEEMKCGAILRKRSGTQHRWIAFFASY